MLAYVLAIAIAVGSLAFYLIAFFLPEVHRRQDFIWSGVGLFYALVLWFCAGRMTGAVLLGQIASGTLVLWLGWQTLSLRWALTPPSVRTPTSWGQVQQRWATLQKQLTGYGKGRSVLGAIAAVGTDLQGAWTQLRQRIAGPRGQTASDAIFDPRTPLSEPPAPPPPPTVSPAPPDTPNSEPTATATPPPEATPGPLNPTSAVTLPPGIKQAVVFKDWVGDLVKSFNRPKPKRAVIDIPPRPPVAREDAKAKPAPPPESGADTAVVEPSSEPEPAAQPDGGMDTGVTEPSPETEESAIGTPEAATEASSEADGDDSIAPEAIAAPEPKVEEAAPSAADAPGQPDPVAAAADGEDDTNWVDDEPPDLSPEVPVDTNEGSEADALVEVDEVEATAEPAPSRWLDDADRSWGDEQPLAPPQLGTVATEPEPTTTEALDEAAPDTVKPINEGGGESSPTPVHEAESNWDDEDANWPD
jgi:hypothetical protein